jgi:transposase-like protein
MGGTTARRFDTSICSGPAGDGGHRRGPRSSISRQAIEGSAEQLRQLRERRWDKTDVLAIYIDGQRFGDHHVISAVVADRGGVKHVLGIEIGATENAAAVKRLLVALRDQGRRTDQKYLFVIDGAKALRGHRGSVWNRSAGAAMTQPQEAEYARRVAARATGGSAEPDARGVKLPDAEEGKKPLEGLSHLLEHEYESAACSLGEGMAEMFMIQRLKLPEWRAEADRQRHPLARRRYDLALGSIRMAFHGETFSQGRAPASVDPGRPPGPGRNFQSL